VVQRKLVLALLVADDAQVVENQALLPIVVPTLPKDGAPCLALHLHRK
jgi:hypothetical protein